MVSSLIELDQQYGDQLVIIGIDDGETPEVIRSFVDENGITYLNLLGDAKTFQDYRVRGHPLTVLITSEGQLFRSLLGYTDKAVLEPDIRALLGIE